MFNGIKQIIKPYVRKYVKTKIPISWVKKHDDSRMAQMFAGEHITPSVSAFSFKIEKLTYLTNKHGAQPLWEGYKGNNIGGSTRTPDVVSTTPPMGNLFTYIAQEINPKNIVEFGTAFGVSGMYFLAGIELNSKGMLFTFEPNNVWAKFAKDTFQRVLAAISEHGISHGIAV